MNPIYDTLEYAGVEKSLRDWGVQMESCDGEWADQKPDTFECSIVNAYITDNPLFDFEGKIIVRSARTSPTGLPGTFSGGAVDFIGKRILDPGNAGGSGHDVKFKFQGPWYDLEHTPYQQSFFGLTAPQTQVQQILLGQVILFTGIDQFGNFIIRNSGQQISDILTYLLQAYAAQGLAAPFQIGTIDPALILMSVIVKPGYCADMIQKCLELSPDCKVAFDYSTTSGGNLLPTINVRQRANLAPVNLALFTGGSVTPAHKSVSIMPRQDLIPSVVIIYFKITGTNSAGGTSILFVKDKYGPNGANSNLDPDGGLRAIVDLIDLQGYSQTLVKGTLSVEPLACTGGDQSSKRAWWASKRGGEEAKFADLRVRFQNAGGAQTTIPDATVVDEAGNAIDLNAYPNRLVDGTVHPWMNVNVIRAVIKSKMVYAEFDSVGASDTDTNGKAIERYASKEHHVHVRLTNAQYRGPGTSTEYTAVASATAGETVPTGIARAVFKALADQIQYEGDYVRVEASFTGGVSMLNVVNYTNGRAEWATMNAHVRGIRKNYGTHETRVSVGPTKHLNANELMSILKMFRFRFPWYNPAVRQTGSPGGGSEVDMALNTPAGNTTDGLAVQPARTLLGYPGNDTTQPPNLSITHDAQAGVITVTPLLANGNRDTAKATVSINPSDIDPAVADPAQLDAKFQKTVDAAGKVIYVLATGVPAGGGGGTIELPFISDSADGDFIICGPPNHPNYVKKPYLLRISNTVRTIRGVNHVYSYSPARVQKSNAKVPFYTRTDSYSGITETQYVIPDWDVGDIVTCYPYTGSPLPPSTVILVTIQSGGTGYAVGNLITPTFAVGDGGAAPQIQVTSVGPGGVIAGLFIHYEGFITSTPPSLPNISCTGGSGSGATVNLTFSSPLIANYEGKAWAA
jgi:hypothetical protein